MSRKLAKVRAASSKSAAAPGFGANPFVGFTSTSGINLSYLAEPPDFSAVSDAHVVVSLKNLQKKDATTKAKALEELLTYVQAHPYEQDGGTEEPVLEAWVQLYPRVSIDNSRRVRELSHNLQFELMKSARKRMEKNVPKIVGPWLAGTFDRDRAVSRAANDGLSSFLTTPEKVTLFWKRCQQQILDYAGDAIKETADTLSDKRSTSDDDAHAKYVRVLAGSLALVMKLLETLSSADIQKCIDSYDLFFENDKVWASAVIDDSNVSRLSSQLLSACIDKRPDRIEADLARISKVFVDQGLKSNHTGSATDFVDALAKATTKYPTIWTSDYRSKRSPVSRLAKFLESGSHGGPPQYWAKLTELLKSIPDSVLPEDPNGAIELLSSMRKGLTGREEPRTNAVEAWSAYLGLARYFLQRVPTSEARLLLCQDSIFPLAQHYLFPSAETSIWASGSQLPILIKAYTSTTTLLFDDLVDATRLEWNRLKAELTLHIRNSLPEASKEFRNSQETVAEEGRKWFALVGKLLEAHEMTTTAVRPIPDILSQLSLELLEESLSILKTRNWKPFSAALVLESAMSSAPLLFKTASATQGLLDELSNSVVRGQLEFLQSPSAPHVLSNITLLGQIPEQRSEFEQIWKSSIAVVMQHLNTTEGISALSQLVSSAESAALALQNPALQAEFVRISLLCAGEGSGPSWDLFKNILAFGALDESSSQTLTRQLTISLAHVSDRPSDGVLKALLVIAEKTPDLLTQDKEVHMSLMLSLLSLSEKGASSEVSTLQTLLEKQSNTSSNAHVLIQQNLNSADATSLSIDTLVQQAVHAQNSLQASSHEEDIGPKLSQFLPDILVWKQQLSALMQNAPSPGLALTSSIGSLCFLVTNDESVDGNVKVPRDAEGCSVPGRMASYLVKLLSAGFDFDRIDLSRRVDLIICLSLTAELAADQLAMMSRGSVWLSLSSRDSQSETFVAAAQSYIRGLTDSAQEWLDQSGPVGSQLVHAIVENLMTESRNLSSLGFYAARCMKNILEALLDRHGLPPTLEQWLVNTGCLKSSPSTVFPAAAILTAFGETLVTSKAVTNFCNRMISDISVAKPGEEKSLITLILLTYCLQVFDDDKLLEGNNRMVFAGRQVSSWLNSPESLDTAFATEACRCLRYILPHISSVYGSHWESSFNFCLLLLNRPARELAGNRIPEIYASLRLMSTLESLGDANDDLVEALDGSKEETSTSLLNVLKLPRRIHNQAQQIVDSLVRRLVQKIPLEHCGDISELYGLVASESRSIQGAAYTLLDRVLPSMQDEISVNVLLEKRDARLPDELLSLLLDAPTLESYPEEILAQFPAAVRSYLLSWRLVFGAFQAASFKVRGDYAENLKSENYIGPLMNFTFDVLGHSAARGLNLDRAGLTAEYIRSYSLNSGESETEEKHMQWLLVHLFYLVLKFVPGLFKAWHINCRSKQTRIAVEAWMTKYFSPLVIAEALDDVVKWNENQEPPAEDEKELIVKVSPAAREVIAGYEVDELNASIAIRIPPEFPLEPVTVVGINRVAVDERKWKSWVMTTQGAITFSGGNIIDGLATFRRNVVGALKGQTECAICYSIISTDRKMPDKRCQTCRNLFHRTCLYKWFQSSNQNTCPLCRNPIDYLGSETRARRGGGGA